MTFYITKKLKFNIKADRDKFVRVLSYIIISLVVISVVLATVGLVGYYSTPRLTLEAGGSVLASDFVGDDEAYFGEDFDPECTKRAGVYHFTVISRGEEIAVRLKVVDTRPPSVEVKDIYCGIGNPYPTPDDFVVSISDFSEFRGEFVEELPAIRQPGKYTAKIRFVDEWGNKTQVFTQSFTIISDSVPPTVTVLGEIEVETGCEIDNFESYVNVSDNCIGEIKLAFDDSAVDYSVAGEYSVKVTATDAYGNKTNKEIIVRVVSK